MSRLNILLVIFIAAFYLGCPSPPVKEDTTPSADTTIPGDAEVEPDITIPDVGCTSNEECEGVIEGKIPECQEVGCTNGNCALVPVSDGTPCTAEGACTLSAVCQEGACVPDQENTCDDDNPCTTDACDPASGCVWTYNQKPCDDDSVCTSGDHCEQGQCVGDVLDCDDANQCTDDTCDKVDGCVWEPREGPCDDGDACTKGETCLDAQCVSKGGASCDDGEACTQDECDPLEGCIYTVLEGPCDDGNACTEDDSCKDSGCVGQVVKCNDGLVCTSDYCDPVQGCVFQANALGCDDGDSCTLNDKCCFPQAGMQCEVGECVAGPIDPLCCDDNPECDDEDLCTDDACVDGYCAFVPKDCDDKLECTADSCAEGICANTPYGPLASGVIYNETWEAGTKGWTFVSTNPDVKWQLDTTEQNQGGKSLYCGKVPEYSYDFGATMASATRTVTLPPSNDIKLSLWVKQDLDESGSCNYDVTRVFVNDVEVIELCSNLLVFTESTYDITAYAGQTITIEIEFATVDGVANNGKGVWVDDVTITASTPEGCCKADADCTEGLGCAAQTCDPTAYKCQVPADACDDKDACTADSCGADGTCTHEPIADCCGADSDCDDGNDCTADTCGEDGQCAFVAIEECCSADADCSDDNACTTDSCGEDGKCVFAAIDGCCLADADCDDSKACTTDACSDEGQCVFTPEAGCCEEVTDCDDANPCTTDSCVDAACSYEAVEDCCQEAADCPPHPEGECAVASCADNTCDYDTSACP